MNELSIELRPDDGRHLYRQIYEYIREEIRGGRLLRDEKLPSARALAEFLQISRSTVDLAYSQLLSEGYIRSKPYKGYYVCPIEGLYNLEEASGTLPARVEAGDEGYEYDFSPNAIDMSAFPFATWKKITRGILVDARSEMFASGLPQGDEPLRGTIARYLHSSRGVNCEPEQIIVGAGNDYLLLLLEKILGRHLAIAMENPTYKRAYRIFDSFAYRISAVGMDREGMRPDELRASGAQAAYIMPSHQYPTGIVMPIGRRMELLRWAGEEEDRYLIEDDYDSEFRYRGKPIPSLQASDRAGKVIYIGTFSKSIAPAIRVSYMVLPPALLNRYRERCGFYSSTVSRIDQTILNEFIRDGYFERYLNKMRKIYKGKRDLLLAGLKPFEHSFDVSGEDAGLHLLLTDREGRGEAELLSAASEQGVKVYGLSDACVGERVEKAMPGTVLLGYGALSGEDIVAGLQRLDKAWL